METDFMNFSHAHSWYKHIPLEGQEVYVSFQDGHWDFEWYKNKWEKIGVRYFTIRVGPFLRGIEYFTGMGRVGVSGFHIIVDKAGESVFREWIGKHYPHLSHLNFKNSWIDYDYPAVIEEIYMTEWQNYFNAYREGCRSFVS